MLTKENFLNLPVFITTMSRWDGDVSSASLALAKVLSKNNLVFYIDYPYSWADVWRERNQPTVKRRMPALLYGKDYLVPVTNQLPNLIGATPAPVLPVYSFPPGKLYDKASAYNNARVAALVKKIAKEKGFKDYIFINSFNPLYLADINQYLKPVLSIYHSRDAIEEVKGHGLYRENECAQQYDLVMATSKQLCRNIAARNQCTVEYFPNGGDVNLFKTAIDTPYPKPKDIANIDTPIIGYTGAVCQRIDYELLVKIAAAHPDKKIVMVGPRKDKEFTSIDLDAIPNIIFTGSKRIDDLPAYLHHFDCTIIPFKKNNLTGGIYPLKINEYLAAGKAVVTTNFSEDIAAFADHVYLVDDHDQFLAAINKALLDNAPEKKQSRLKAAETNSWEHRLSLFWNLAWAAYQKKQSVSLS
ncbi:MAG: glycosyltransferase [Ferruginibacter sp.]